MAPTEWSDLDHDKEAGASVRHVADHEEEKRVPLKLSEDPQAFVGGNPELLARQGVIPEKDEARLDDKTTLKFDMNEGLTIIHKNQHYKITTVEQEKIGDLELNRYKARQGEEFLHIPRENMTIPPYETPWYALSPHTEICLDKNYRHELLEAAINKAGGAAVLGRELEERGTHINVSYLSDHLYGQQDGMRADKLIPILTYIDRHLNEPNSHITAMGGKRAIENPNLPFKLDNIDGARIHAARFSDGTLPAFQDGRLLFSYANNDAEQRNRTAESLENIFGRANISNKEYGNEEVAKVRTSTEVIGHVLQRSGAITGEIIVQNPDVPTFIREGSKEMKREWLKQAFGDEGSVSPKFGLVSLSRVVDPTHRLSDEQRNRVDALSEGWQRKLFPSGWEKAENAFRALPGDIREALEPERPRLLESEETMLHDDFGINTNKYPREIYTREGGYGFRWVLQTNSSEDSRMFYNEIGFPQRRKQEALMRMLSSKGE
ncbi:MAG: hypothetical protein WED04_05260 [Promethearchaeati archaeon SRVP18_Atabeyarchaeia-1]